MVLPLQALGGGGGSRTHAPGTPTCRFSSYLKASSYEFTRVTLGEDKIPQTRINKGFSDTNADISPQGHTTLI